jgi:membrane peptidoglycan carboxypeptidase
VLSSGIADTVTDILKGVIAFGTGTGADIGRPNGVAGKTGTAENYSDAWFVGFSKTLSTSVWMGYANSQRPLVGIKGVDKVFGGTLPAATWKDFMGPALQGVPDDPFPGPGIVPTSAPPPDSGVPSGGTGGDSGTGPASPPANHGGPAVPPASVEPQPGPVYTVPPDTTPPAFPPSPPNT